MLRRLFAPLHVRTSCLPPSLQAVLAPLQAAHLRLLERELAPSGPTTLEEAVRPALLPTERWEDTEGWRKNLRLLAWLRSAYFRALPCSQERLPAARANLRARLRDHEAPAPTLKEARELFGLSHPTGEVRSSCVERALARRAGEIADASEHVSAGHQGGDTRTVTTRSGSTRGLPLAEVLEASGGLISKRGAWAAFAEEHGVYELVTRELVDALASYVQGRADDLLRPSGCEGEELRILEAGAGNGELAHYLRSALRERGVQATVVACDNGSWPLADDLRFDGVEPLPYRAALRRHTPHLVLCSWMPMAVDWSAEFRRCESTREYLLLGEVLDGACGHNYLTWGNPEFALDSSAASSPYEMDGWTMHEVHEVSRWQLSRFAADEADSDWNSCCVAFRRGTG